MSQKKLNFALIGAGAISTHHVNALRQLDDDVNVVKVYSRDEAEVRELGEKLNVAYTNNMDEILMDPDIDVVNITLPSGLHAETGVKVANAGKHVIVEKPIDVTLEKADALIKACKENGVTLGVISQYRFMEPMQQFYDLLKQGKLGKLIHAEASIKWYRPMDYYNSAAWRGTYELDGGGPFMNQGIHFIDLLLSVMGPVKWVSGKTRTCVHDIEVEDIGMAMVEFASGATGVIQASTATFPGLPARLDVHGTDGTVVIEGEKMAFKHLRGEEPYREGGDSAGGASKPLAIDIAPFVREFGDIISAIREKREPVISGAEARRALQLILAVYDSSRQNKPIIL